MTASQMRIAETIDAFYGDAGANDGVSRSYKQAVEDLDAETIKALDGPFRYTLLMCQCDEGLTLYSLHIDKQSWNPSHASVPTSPISTNVSLFPVKRNPTPPPATNSQPTPSSSLTTHPQPPRHQKTQPQTPRLRRHPRQSKKTRRKTRQRPHQTPPRRARLRPRQNSLRSPQRPTLYRTTATNRFTRSVSRSEL